MNQMHYPALMQRSPYSFQTLAPGALATLLMTEHSFTEQTPLGNEVYRLGCDGMVIAVFRLGLVLAEGRNAPAAVLLLKDLCDADGGGA